ncbi:MAG: hypothetical protein V4603_14315 [Pseudomonadota bacterium]
MNRTMSNFLKALVLLVSCGVVPLQAQAAGTGPQLQVSDAALQVFALAESLYPELFARGGEVLTTQGYRYRFYAGTGIYVGLKDEQIYLLGGAFGNAIVNKGSVTEVLTFLQAEQNRRQLNGSGNAASEMAKARARLIALVNNSWNRNGSTTTGTVPLTHFPMNMADVDTIVPLGLLSAGHVTPIDHIYFSPINFNSAPGTYNVYVVADGLLTEISTRQTPKGLEHRVVLQHSGTYYSYYDLIDVLDPAIASQIPAGAIDGGKLFHGPIAVRGGQVLGRIGGKTLDFANVNLQTFLPGFIEHANYEREPWKSFTVDTFAAYAEPLRNQMLAKNQRVAEPRGGKIDYDVAGTLSGNWFRLGTNGYAGVDPENYSSGHLAVVPYVLDPSFWVVSLGEFKGQPTQLGVRGNTPVPTAVTVASGVIKMELVQPPNGPPPLPDNSNTKSFGTVLFQVLPNNLLRMEVFPDVAPASVSGFTSAALIYER